MSIHLPLELDRFALPETLGHGGSAVVFGGLDRLTSLPVAVKLFKAPSTAQQRAAFGREIRAAASLDHPGVVRILDYGQVRREDAERSHGKLEPGAPYIVMPRALGTLDRWVQWATGWDAVCDILRQLLGALAHAHSRGVIHRDLKPTNVLVSSVRPISVELADFGIAHRVGDDAEEQRIVLGTPAYMAPEQILALTADIGPWTDLYALGCVGWALLCGTVPFSGRGRAQMESHLRSARPKLTPRFPVPAETERLFASLIARHPRDRFHRAADVLGFLDALDRPELGTRAPAAVSSLVAEATTRVHTRSAAEALPADLDQERLEGSDVTSPRALIRVPVLSSDAWQDDTNHRHFPAASGGWKMFRSLPLTGRLGERSALWSGLTGAIAEARPHVLALVGPSGIGKSHLARWLVERGHELGAIEPMRAVHGGDRHTSGVVAMVARAFGECGLPTPARVARVLRLRRHPADVIEQAASMVALLGPDQAIAAREEEFHACFFLLGTLADPRLPVLWLDDFDLDPDSVGFACWLLGQPHPVLVVGTATDPAALAPLTGREGYRELRVGPLATPDLRSLLARVAPLDPSLGERLAEQVAGNAAHAVETLRRWIEREWLVPGPAGATLAAGVSLDETQPLGSVWRERTERFLGGRPVEDALALELAAVIGPEVPISVWSDLCEQSRVPLDPSLGDALSEAGLAIIGDDGALTFVHGQLRAAILQRAAEGGRWVRHHGAAAAVATQWRDWESAGRHLLAADRAADAVEPLLRALERRARRYEPAALLAEEAERAMTLGRIPPADPRWGRMWVVRAAERVQHRDDHGARTAIDRTLIGARQYGWALEHAWALFWDASLQIYAGAMADAGRLAAEAEHRFQAIGELSGRCRALLLRSAALRYSGEPAESFASASEGLGIARELSDDLLLARAHQVMSESHLVDGAGTLAAHHSRAALAYARRMGSAMETARASNGLADAMRSLGELDEARRLYAEAARLYTTSGVPWFKVYPLLNQALMALLDGRPGEAEPILRELVASARPQFMGSVHLGFVVVAAHHRQWERFVHHLSEAEACLATVFDADNARLAELAAEVAEQNGRADLGRRARATADQQWDKTGGRPER